MRVGFKLLYKASKDGFSAFSFHMKVDNRGPTITLIKSAINDKIFGGYTSVPITSSLFKWVKDEKAFLFNLTDSRKYEQLPNRSS